MRFFLHPKSAAVILFYPVVFFNLKPLLTWGSTGPKLVWLTKNEKKFYTPHPSAKAEIYEKHVSGPSFSPWLTKPAFFNCIWWILLVSFCLIPIIYWYTWTTHQYATTICSLPLTFSKFMIYYYTEISFYYGTYIQLS